MSYVVVVPVSDEASARAVMAGGGAVVVAGTDAEAVGRLVAALRAEGGRAAGYIGCAGDSAAEEMAREIFPT